MTPLQIIRSLEALTSAIEVAVARADWSEAVRAAETRSAFLMTLVPDQPDEVHAAIGRMRETDIRISTTARETLEALVTEGRNALYETRLAAQPQPHGADATVSRSPSWLS
ncbi:hypothetical protein BLA39750_03425 [Burkholderia lata]|uniref:Flagellar protein FliT n=1 Tax=Burkholderia lata (strain ATCC 17760 / DSM 23089 / LMG 22485 / NCIMB 9086 / R18194 / 383) TaxID=482957 RepID=A0A6P2Y1A6_BURL3|nr:hypothetical protein [Burkholderia lata]VWD13996.1 hypothetical protein BLA39750_03425 [Burkholderia lata]